jgi:hypothetical protein
MDDPTSWAEVAGMHDEAVPTLPGVGCVERVAKLRAKARKPKEEAFSF